MITKSFSIENWMINKYCLNGNELVGFAFLWKRTNGGKERYDGGYSELAAAIGVTIPTTYNVLRKLTERGLLEFGGVRDGINVTATAA